MRAVIQRVSQASVEVDGRAVGEIGSGLLVLLGVAEEDSSEDLNYLSERIPQLRIFNDAEGKMNLSLLETGGQILVVSQFTLYANTRKGRRPSYVRAAKPDKAQAMYEDFIKRLQQQGIQVATGVFGARMIVKIFNDGPVTLILDSEERLVSRRKFR